MKTYPVTVLCRMMRFCPSGFYAWLKAPVPETNLEDKKIEHKVREIFHESHSAFGSRRISQHMKKQGFSRQVVGWHVDDSMTSELCKQALINAYWRRKPKKGFLHHSDR